MISGIGATVSTAATGFVAGSLGSGWTFAMLAGVAGAALAVGLGLLPETAHEAREEGSGRLGGLVGQAVQVGQHVAADPHALGDAHVLHDGELVVGAEADRRPCGG